MSCLAFLFRDFSRRPSTRKSCSDGDWSSTIDQLLGFSIFTTTGVPLRLSFPLAHHSNFGAIFLSRERDVKATNRISFDSKKMKTETRVSLWKKK